MQEHNVLIENDMEQCQESSINLNQSEHALHFKTQPFQRDSIEELWHLNSFAEVKKQNSVPQLSLESLFSENKCLRSEFD